MYNDYWAWGCVLRCDLCPRWRSKKGQKLSCVKLAICPDHPRRHSFLKFCMRCRVREVVIFSGIMKIGWGVSDTKSNYCRCDDCNATEYRHYRLQRHCERQCLTHWLAAAAAMRRGGTRFLLTFTSRTMSYFQNVKNLVFHFRVCLLQGSGLQFSAPP